MIRFGLGEVDGNRWLFFNEIFCIVHFGCEVHLINIFHITRVYDIVNTVVFTAVITAMSIVVFTAVFTAVYTAVYTVVDTFLVVVVSLFHQERLVVALRVNG